MATSQPTKKNLTIAGIQNCLNQPSPPAVVLLKNVILAFVRNIPEDSKPSCVYTKNKIQIPFPTHDKSKQTDHLVNFVQERLDKISLMEYFLWLNGELPFITPRELMIWRLRQYVEFIWAFQLPDDDDLAMIFNTTKRKAAYLSTDFIARFRKALLFPCALRRIYRILNDEDPNYHVGKKEVSVNKTIGSYVTFPTNKYILDINTLVDELRPHSGKYLREAQVISYETSQFWVDNLVIDLVRDRKKMMDILSLYPTP